MTAGDADARRENFGEAADIEDVAVSVEGFDRGERLARETQVAVGVILEDHDVVFLREAQDLPALM